jgi:hypothetical protein
MAVRAPRATFWNMVRRLVPSRVTAAMMTTAMSETHQAVLDGGGALVLVAEALG